MRKEPFSVGSYVHVLKRGARGSDIVRDDADRWRFLKLITYLNDDNVPRNWERQITREHITKGFSRPKEWPQAKPYVSVLAFCLLDNHFHLLLQEQVENGVAKFMQRLGTSMASHFNARHAEKGTLFQGSYKSRTIDSDEYLQYLSAYIQVKNAFELYPGGLDEALRHFDEAYEWASSYPFSSLSDYAGSKREMLDHSAIESILPANEAFMRFAKDVVFGKYAAKNAASEMLFDDVE